MKILSYISEKPQIIDIFTSSNTIKKEGDPLELTCDASGIPKPVISWTMVGGGVLPTGGRELTVSYKCHSSVCFVIIEYNYLNTYFTKY
jgi:hypothetical protein